jgi:hypothetical protein
MLTPENADREKPRTKQMLKRAGVLGFTFFLVKGLIWLAVLLYGANVIM